jgi:hypothetical protein
MVVAGSSQFCVQEIDFFSQSILDKEAQECPGIEFRDLLVFEGLEINPSIFTR